jgi:hypothetical protein
MSPLFRVVVYLVAGVPLLMVAGAAALVASLVRP